MRLMIAPLIDVVFLLLIFFLLAVNFRPAEGFLPVELPRRDGAGEAGAARPGGEVAPLMVRVDTVSDGRCAVQVGGDEAVVFDGTREGFVGLRERLAEALRTEGRGPEDPVVLAPTAGARWDHVVRTYDALWRLQLSNIVFALVEQTG